MNFKKTIPKQQDKIQIRYNDLHAIQQISQKMLNWFPTIPREYVVVFIGTDRSTGDALGPLSGTIFHDMKPRHMTIYGTLHNPVHAKNLSYYKQQIYLNHDNPFIIAVDACLGRVESIGHLIAGIGPIQPGSALNKDLPSIGDVYITGVVNISGFMEYSILQSTRLATVMDMAQQIARILDTIDQHLTYMKPVATLSLPHK